MSSKLKKCLNGKMPEMSDNLIMVQPFLAAITQATTGNTRSIKLIKKGG